MWPSRIAMSGLLATPGGSTDIMYLIGKEETLKRLQAGLEKIKEKQEEDSKPFFVHTITDDGVSSDYADAKEAYENR